METQRLWNKVHSTSYTQEQEGWIRLCLKTFKKACTVLKRQKVFVKIETNINLYKNDKKRNIWRRKRTPHEHKAYHVICHAGDKTVSSGSKSGLSSMVLYEYTSAVHKYGSQWSFSKKADGRPCPLKMHNANVSTAIVSSHTPLRQVLLHRKSCHVSLKTQLCFCYHLTFGHLHRSYISWNARHSVFCTRRFSKSFYCRKKQHSCLQSCLIRFIVAPALGFWLHKLVFLF